MKHKQQAIEAIKTADYIGSHLMFLHDGTPYCGFGWLYVAVFGTCDTDIGTKYDAVESYFGINWKTFTLVNDEAPHELRRQALLDYLETLEDE